MAFRDEYGFETLINEAERLVIQELERQTLDLDERWRSEECLLDMAAYALNRVRPAYRANLIGALYAQIGDDAYASEIRQSVREAIEMVRQNPPD